MLRSKLAWCAVLTTSALLLAACGGGSGSGGSGDKVQLSLVAYSTPQEAYEQIIKAYQKTPQGRNVTFTKSFGGSGDQSRAVESGLRADIVAFSLEPDMTRLVKAKLVAEDLVKVTFLPCGVFWYALMICSYASCGVEYATSDSCTLSPEPPEPEPPPHAASRRALVVSTAHHASLLRSIPYPLYRDTRTRVAGAPDCCQAK